MAGTGRLALGLAAVAMLTTAATGCGGGGSTTSAGNSTVSKNPHNAAARQRLKNEKGTADTGTHGQITYQGPPPSVRQLSRDFPTLGALKAGRHEAGNAERAAASASLEAFMVGRANEDWEAVCESLSAAMIAQVEELVPYPHDCVENLALATGHRTIWAPANKMKGPIDGLLIEGSSGYALYHGRDGNYLVSMVREDGEWKVNTLEAMAL